MWDVPSVVKPLRLKVCLSSVPVVGKTASYCKKATRLFIAVYYHTKQKQLHTFA